MVGGRSPFYCLSEAERAAYTEAAKALYDAGMEYEKVERNVTTKRGFVYMVSHPAFPLCVKIGRAFDPESRLAQFQTGCPLRQYRLDYAFYFNDCHAAEALLHEALADERMEGEWFTTTGISPKQIAKAIQAMQIKEEFNHVG